jgi:phage tail sheath protein FI
MAFQLSPGVLVTEIDNTPGVPSVATSAGAFSGAFQWGPVEEVTTIDTEKNLVTRFGNPDDTTAGYFFTAANFLSYGNNLKIVRVVDKSIARNAVGTPSGKVTGVRILSSANSYTTANDITVTFTASQNGTTATGNAILSSAGRLQAVNMALRGYGYNVPPTVTLNGGGGGGATVAAVLSAGQIQSLTLTGSGNNYSSTSNVVIENQTSTGASANLTIHFKVVNLQLNSGGTNYGPAGSGANIVFSGNIVSGATHATANLVVTGNVITGYVLTSSGNGYIGAPNVIINRRDGNTGSEASFTANIGYGYINTINLLANGTASYSYAPNVTINKNSNVYSNTLEVATANSRIAAQIDSINVLATDISWTEIPTVTITPAAADVNFISSNAIAVASVGYSINRINIINQGSGYTSVPTVTIINSQSVASSGTANVDFVAPLITNNDNYISNYSSGGFAYGEFAAKYPGKLGNSIKVSFADKDSFTGWQYSNQFNSVPGTSAYVSARGGADDEMHIIIVDADGAWTGTAGSILEKFSYVSKASDSKNSDNSTNYYKDIINNQSKYVVWLDHSANDWGALSTTNFTTLGSNVTYTLGGGADGSDITAGNVQAGYQLFSNDELYDVSLIPMGPTTDVGVVNTVIGIAESRRDCVVFVSPPYTSVVNATNQSTNIITYRNQLTSSSFAVLDSGWKYQYDRYNDKYRYVALNGDIAGLSARTDYIADPWFSPAGYNRGVIKNVVKLAYSPSKTDRDDLYKIGINPVVTFPGQGTLLFGDKTLLSRPSAFDRINVRRLFIVLEKAIATASKFQLFEFNDPFTRAQFRNLVEPFLRDVQGRRGITDFRVVCDETNNTGDIVDRNEFVADIYIKPARAINFIQLNFVATRTGVSFEEVGA